MLRKQLTVAMCVAVVAGCQRGQFLSGDHPPQLIGTWQLLIRSSCDRYGIKTDTLVLYADGSFDQHVVLNDGKQMILTRQHWRYYPGSGDGDIALDKRLEFFTPEYFGKQAGEGVGTFEMLIIEIHSEPVIVLNPDSDCVYTRTSAVAP